MSKLMVSVPFKPGVADRLGIRKPKGPSAALRKLFAELRYVNAMPDDELLARAKAMWMTHDEWVKYWYGVRLFREYRKEVEQALRPVSTWERLKAAFRR